MRSDFDHRPGIIVVCYDLLVIVHMRLAVHMTGNSFVAQTKDMACPLGPIMMCFCRTHCLFMF